MRPEDSSGLLRRCFDWRIPVAMLLGVATLGTVLHLLDPARNPAPWVTLACGGVLFGAVFMATDPVSSPTTPRGAWAFGLGIGILVVVIRGYGGLPEGVMYAILLMNAATPLLERAFQPRPFGRPSLPAAATQGVERRFATPEGAAGDVVPGASTSSGDKPGEKQRLSGGTSRA